MPRQTGTEGEMTVERYLGRIRNKAKRDYGFRYFVWLSGRRIGAEPDRGALSFMGAQAVRIAIQEILSS